MNIFKIKHLLVLIMVFFILITAGCGSPEDKIDNAVRDKIKNDWGSEMAGLPIHVSDVSILPAGGDYLVKATVQTGDMETKLNYKYKINENGDPEEISD